MLPIPFFGPWPSGQRNYLSAWKSGSSGITMIGFCCSALMISSEQYFLLTTRRNMKFSNHSLVMIRQPFCPYTPSNDGNVIRLVFPEVTEERRKALVKDVKKKGEDAKVAVRNVRRDGNDFLKKLGKEDVSEDEIKELEDQLQKLTDKFGKDIDKLVEAKSKEIMTV